MSIPLISKIKPKNNGSFPLVDAVDIEMPDGRRLDELALEAYPVTEGVAQLQPERFYDFGTVSTLAVTLTDVDDGLAHEYCFEFVAAEDFEGFSVTPEPRWTSPTQIIPNKTHQVSILRGIGVMVCA